MGVWADINAQKLSGKRAKGKANPYENVAVNLLRMRDSGHSNIDPDSIAEICDLSLEQVQTLAKNITHSITQQEDKS